MEDGDKIQYACGHWLTAGQFGLQDSYAKSITAKRCGDCQQRLHDAAPDLLAALEGRVAGLPNHSDPRCGVGYPPLVCQNCSDRAAIAKAKGY